MMRNYNESILSGKIVNNQFSDTVNENTPVGALTIGQLRAVLLSIDKEPPRVTVQEKDKKYVYGLAGIRQLFGVSHATAQRYKDTIIKDAVMQQGRKIIVDADKALELFKENQ